MYISYSVSIISLVFVTVDRFVATMFPMKVIMITRKIRAVFILLTWVFSMEIIYPLFHFSRTNSDESNETISLSDEHEHEQGVKDHLLHGGFCATLLCTSCHYFHSQLPNHQILQESKSGDWRKQTCPLKKTWKGRTTHEDGTFDQCFLFHLLDGILLRFMSFRV